MPKTGIFLMIKDIDIIGNDTLGNKDRRHPINKIPVFGFMAEAIHSGDAAQTAA